MTPTLTNLKPFFDREQPLPGGTLHAPGVYVDSPDDGYRAFRGLNSSVLKQPTAAEMWDEMTQPPLDKWGIESECEKWTTGILTHWAVLEPFRFRDLMAHCIVSPTKGLATDRCQALRVRYPDKLLVTPEHLTKAAQCREAIEANPDAVQVLSGKGANEVTVVAFDRDREYWRKGRFDRLPIGGNFILDVKTTVSSLSKWHFKDVIKYAYHVQAAWYLDLYEQATGHRMDKFVWVVVTKYTPFMSRVYYVDNWPPGHGAYNDSPLKAAREMIAAREASWVMGMHETIGALERGMELTPSLVRSTWPAYEQMGMTPVVFA